MIRKVTAIIVSYAIFVISALALFKFSGQAPHANPSIGFAVLAAVYGAFFSFIAGFVAQLIAKTIDLKINYVLALIIAGFATFSLLKTEGHHWTQLFAILIFTPASILGGLYHLRRNNGNTV
jgi:hypothetical protein